MRRVYLILFLLISTSFLFAQTNPAAHNLGTSNFTFTGFGDGATTTYPTSMQGWSFGAEPTSSTVASPSADRVLVASSTSITTGSIRNEVGNGISLLNSGTNNIGAIVVAVNTTGRENIKVTWTAQQLNSGGSGATDRINGLQLQYRVGTSGDFTTISSTEYLTTNTTSQNPEETFTNIELPSAADNQAVVQVRWIYYISSGSANARDRIRLDDITISSDEIAGNTQPVIISPSATSITKTSVNLSSNITSDGGDAVTARGFVYSVTTTNGDPLIGGTGVTNVPSGSGTGSFNETVSSLAAGTQYTFKGYATNTEGTSYTNATNFTTLKEEPTNHITNLDYSLTDIWIELNWTGSVGVVLPDGYLILGKIGAGTFASVVDGTPVANDDDWSDNNFANNVIHQAGTNSYRVTGLNSNTEYSFRIYPYTNSEANIDFKTDGSIPEISQTTANLITNNDFEVNLGWTAHAMPGSFAGLEWSRQTTGGGANSTTAYAEMNGFSGSSQQTDTWLISDALNFSTYDYEGLEFYTQWNFGSQNESNFLKLKYSTDYDGNTANIGTATWNELSFTFSSSSNTWQSTGLISFPNISSASIYIAFHYVSDDAARRWRVDEVRVFGTSVNPLPVELTSFTAALVNNSVVLNWQTATEVNNYGFEVQRTPHSPPFEKGGKQGGWEQIGFVEGHGNSNAVKDYSFADKSISAGAYSYRLKQIDTDGTYEYSPVVEIDITTPADFSIAQNYPNPFNPVTTISYTLPVNSNVKLAVYNLLGEEVAMLVNSEQQAGVYNISFDAAGLASGTYIYRIIANDFVQTSKMILMK